MPSAEDRWKITCESLAALEESHAWKTWLGVNAYGWTTLYVYGPDGRMGYWGMVWTTAQAMRSTLCQNMGGGVPIEVIDQLVSLSHHPANGSESTA